MNTVKLERINSAIVKEVSKILSTEIKNSNLAFVTVTAAKISNDFSYCKIYVTCLNDDKRKDIMEALRGAKGFIRKELASRLDIRHTPELDFIYDKSIEYGNNIERKIREIHEHDEEKES